MFVRDKVPIRKSDQRLERLSAKSSIFLAQYIQHKNLPLEATFSSNCLALLCAYIYISDSHDGNNHDYIAADFLKQ